MRHTGLVWTVATGLLVSIASSALGDYTVTYVGQNPYVGFPSDGGTGSIASQQPGSATLEKTFTSLGDIPIIVDGQSLAATETLHIDERVRNQTGMDWTDFHFLVQPIDADAALQVAFQNVTNPTGEWSVIVPGPNVLTLLGSVPDGSEFSISFDLVISAGVDTFNLFAIHENPTIPEPSALLLMAGAILALHPRRLRLVR